MILAGIEYSAHEWSLDPFIIFNNWTLSQLLLFLEKSLIRKGKFWKAISDTVEEATKGFGSFQGLNQTQNKEVSVEQLSAMTSGAIKYINK